MAEYIKREDAIKAIKEQEDSVSYDINMGLIMAMNAIADMPAADVVEVKRGCWEPDASQPYGEDWTCSVCGNNPCWHRTEKEVLPLFCPWCGAKMEGTE